MRVFCSHRGWVWYYLTILAVSLICCVVLVGTICVTFHEFSSRLFACFHGNRLLSSCAYWANGWINVCLLGIRSCVSCVLHLRLVSPPFERGGNVLALCDPFSRPVSIRQDQCDPVVPFFVLFFSCIPWPFAGSPEAMFLSFLYAYRLP